MKVLILHNDLRVYWKRRLYFLKDFLKSKNIDLHVLELFGKGSPYTFDPYDNTELWWNCLFPQNRDNELSNHTIKKALFSKLSSIDPDIIIAGSIVFYSGALGLRWAKNNGKKFIMFDDAKPSDVKRSVLVQQIKNLITNQVDAFWLPSKDYYEEYSFLYDQKDIHFFYGYNCIDNNLFNFKEEKRFDNKKIICVARLVPIKNLENLLKAWLIVEQNTVDEKLLILGEGGLLPDLNKLLKELGLKRVEFLGSMPNDRIPQHLFNADGFILPSWSESWGLVVNEAMAAGLPVLLSNHINAANTLLKENINGYSFNPSKANEISEKLLQFIRLPEDAKKEMSKRSLEIIASMSYENMGKELLDTLLLLSRQQNKKNKLVSYLLINLWHGRYNTLGWDNIKVK